MKQYRVVGIQDSREGQSIDSINKWAEITLAPVDPVSLGERNHTVTVKSSEGIEIGALYELKKVEQ